MPCLPEDDVGEEGGVEVQSGCGDLLGQLADERQHVGVQGRGQAFPPLFQQHPQFGHHAFPGVHMRPAVLKQPERRWETLSIMT